MFVVGVVDVVVVVNGFALIALTDLVVVSSKVEVTTSRPIRFLLARVDRGEGHTDATCFVSDGNPPILQAVQQTVTP